MAGSVSEPLLVTEALHRLLRPGLGQYELGATLKPEPERRGFRSLLARLEVAEAARRHQVHEQDELTVLGREEEPFRAAPGAGQPAALERVERRVEGLERRDVRRAGLLDRKGRDRAVERAAPGLHLG